MIEPNPVSRPGETATRERVEEPDETEGDQPPGDGSVDADGDADLEAEAEAEAEAAEAEARSRLAQKRAAWFGILCVIALPLASSIGVGLPGLVLFGAAIALIVWVFA